MNFFPVDWVLVVFYGPSAHRATYGRFSGSTRYTKDFIQLSRRSDFLESVSIAFSEFRIDTEYPIKLVWPSGIASGSLQHSADRLHLKWETADGAPSVWKMSLNPSENGPETLLGNPHCKTEEAAELEYEKLITNVGQPYLLAVKLREEMNILHLRVYIDEPAEGFQWAELSQTPQIIEHLARSTSQERAIGWDSPHSYGRFASLQDLEALVTAQETDDLNSYIHKSEPEKLQTLLSYFDQPGHGLFFDPSKNHNAWKVLGSHEVLDRLDVPYIIGAIHNRLVHSPESDSLAEKLPSDETEVEAYKSQILHENFSVPDVVASIKTRGSAQRAFADAVKRNYQHRCAITGIGSPQFLVAAHIVPWSKDSSIRLDPSNGICLSPLVDCAFEKGFLTIDDNLVVRVNWVRVGDDKALSELLAKYDGQPLNEPIEKSPNRDFLRRRRELLEPPES